MPSSSSSTVAKKKYTNQQEKLQKPMIFSQNEKGSVDGYTPKNGDDGKFYVHFITITVKELLQQHKKRFFPNTMGLKVIL